MTAVGEDLLLSLVCVFDSQHKVSEVVSFMFKIYLC